MNELSGEFADEANEYLSVIERAAVQKRNAEREIDRAASQYRRAYSRARRKSTSRHSIPASLRSIARQAI